MKWVFPIRQKWILSLVLGGLAASSEWWYVSQKEKNIQNIKKNQENQTPYNHFSQCSDVI